MTLRPRLPITSAALALIAATALAPRAQASGFSLREQSPSALGSAFAGVSAGGTDISAMFWNPAAMSLYGNQFILGSSLIIPSAEIANAKAMPAPMFPQTPFAGPGASPNSVNPVPLPAIYGTWGVSEDFRLGLSINVPYGMVVQYNQDFVGRYHALRTSLKTVDVSPNFSYRVTPEWSVGGAFIARMVKAELTNYVDFGAIGQALGLPGYAPGNHDAVAALEGDKWVYGFKVGTIVQPVPELRLGLAYSGKTTVDLNNGKVKYTGVPAAFASKFVDGGAGVALDLPDTVSAGLHWDLTKEFAVQGEIAKTSWSKFKELRVKFASGQADSVVDESWKDTTYFSVGGVWKYNNELTLRFGYAHDQAPMDDFHRTPRVPDGDRNWFSVGTSYAFSKQLSVDFALTHIQVKDGTINLQSGTTPADPNFFRGTLTGTFKNKVDIVAIQARYNW
ncbi:MAG: porin [Acidobacteria bacterium]|nr:porin [Acidobacteriota bacterium]